MARLAPLSVLIEEVRSLLWERKAYPVGTRRKWKNGEFEKRADGSWMPVTNTSSPASSPEPSSSNGAGSVELTYDPDASRRTTLFDRESLRELRRAMDVIRHPPPTDPDEYEKQYRAQIEIRNGFRTLLSDFGLQSRDVHFGRVGKDSYSINPEAAACWGYHTWKGEVQASAKTHHLARAFMYDAMLGHPERADAEAFGRFKALVHEEIHGTSPISSNLYYGTGAALEEATVELAARKICSDQFGIRPSKFEEESIGTYGTEIAALREATKATLLAFNMEISDDALFHALGEASLEMRRRPPPVEFNNGMVMKRFADCFPLPKGALKQAGFRDEKGTEEMFREALADTAISHLFATTKKPALKAESATTRAESVYDLRRNDFRSALELAVRLKAAGKLTPETIKVLVKLQDDHKGALRALNKIAGTTR